MKLLLPITFIMSAFLFSACGGSSSDGGSAGGGAASKSSNSDTSTCASKNAYVITTYDQNEDLYYKSNFGYDVITHFEAFDELNIEQDKVYEMSLAIVVHRLLGTGRLTFNENISLEVTDTIANFQGSIICLKKCVLDVRGINQDIVNNLDLQGDIKIYNREQRIHYINEQFNNYNANTNTNNNQQQWYIIVN